MKFKNREITDIVNFLGAFESKKLPQRISYAIMRNSVIFAKEYKIYETALTNLFNSYKDNMLKDNKGNIISNKFGVPLVSDDVKEEFEKELQELFDIEIDITPHYIDEALFDYDDSCGKYDSLSANDIYLLSNLMCKNEDE